MKAKNNFKMTKKGIIFLFAIFVSVFGFNAEAQDRCLNVCPEQGALINVSGEDAGAVNAVVCIDNLTGSNHVIQNGSELGELPEALYTCYTVAVSNTSGAGFDISSATYSIGNVLGELETALLGSDECGSVSPTAKTFDINSSYCTPDGGGTCMLNVCPCNEGAGTDFVFEYVPADNTGDTEELFIVVDAGGAVVAVSATSPISAAGLAQGDYQIYAVIYDAANAGNLPGLLATGNALADIQTELTATACGSISAPVNASVDADACSCEDDTNVVCITEVCECNGDANEITLSTDGYTADGDNQQWYIVVSGGNIVTSQQAGTDGSVTFSGLPDGSHQIYAVNYDPVANPNVATALADGNAWSDVTDGISSGAYCAAAVGPQDISINGACDCPGGECTADEGSVSADGSLSYCDDADETLAITVSGNDTGNATIVLITTDNPLTSDIYDIVGIAEASPGMYNLATGSSATYNVLGLDPGSYCIHSFNFDLADFSPMMELQILNSSSGFITSVDALIPLTSTDGTRPICGSITTTACQAFTINPLLSFDATISCDAADLFNYAVDVSNVAGGDGSTPTITITDSSGTSYSQGDAIPNDTQVTITVSDGSCSSSSELNGNCLDVDCPASALADASNQAACGGDAISLSVKNVIGESGLSTADYSVSWSSSDASVDLSDVTNVSLSNTDCQAEEITFTATLTCADGSGTLTSEVNVTVYPNDVSNYVSYTGDGSCDPRIVVDADCDGVVLTGTRTPSQIYPDQSGDASWDLVYIFQGNNTPALGACALSGSYLTPFQCAPVCATPDVFNIDDSEVCSGGSITLPNLEDAITSLNFTGNLYANYSWTSTDGFSSNDGSIQEVEMTNTECAPKKVIFSYEITCSIDGSAVRSGDFEVTVYPTDISSFVEVEGEGECLVSLVPVASCGLYISGDSFVAEPGEEGTASLTVTYTGGGSCDVSYSADVNYFCEDPITCNAGTITGGAVSFVCSNEFAIASTTDSEGFLNYILHDGDDTTLGMIYASSVTGVFTNDGSLPVNLELCISAVAGSDQLDNGLPDPDGECYDISECSRVVFISPMEITIDQTCNETTGLVDVTYTITGGAPEYLPMVHFYNVLGTGGHTNSSAASGETYELGSFDPATSVAVSVNDDGKGCSAEADDLTIPCIPAPTCDDAGTIAGSINFVCDEEFAVIAAIETEASLVYVVHDGDDNAIGTIFGSSDSGVFVNDGTLPINVELCVSSVTGSDIDSSGIPDPDGECYDISNCAKIVFLSPITVEVDQTCDTSTGLVSISYTVSGGAPEYLPNVHAYQISGPAGYTNSDAASGETYAYGEVSPGADFGFSIDDDGKGCSSGFDFTSIECDTDGTPSISIVKTADASGVTDPAVAGQVINYSFVVCNTGDVDLTDVSVSDDLAPVSGSVDLAAGACDETTFTSSYTITEADIAAGNVENSAIASGTYTDPDGVETVVNDKDIAEVMLEGVDFVPNPEISIVKTADASGVSSPAVAGEVINYSFVVCNTGNVDLTGVSVSDDLAPVSGSVDLAAGACDETTFTSSYTITEADIAAGNVENSAIASGTYTDPDGVETVVNDKDIAEVPLQGIIFVPNPAISVVKTANASGVTSPAVAGQIITYSFVVCNTGNVDLSNVTLDDNLVTVTGTTSLAVDACDAITFTASYSITDADITAGSVVNTVIASGTYTDPDGMETVVTDEDDAVVNLTPAQCNNNAGVMPAPQGLDICYGNYASTPTAGAVIDGGSSLTYVLHNGVNSSLGQTLDYNNTGLFSNDGFYPTGIELYVCAVVSPSTGGFPDLNSDCTDISDECTPVTFLSQIQVEVEVDCSQSGNYTVVFEVTGGLPAAENGSTYSVTGDYTGFVSANSPTSAGPLSAGTFYSLNFTDDAGCGATVVSEKIVCEKLPIELISYTGEAQAQGNMLKWITASEIENDYFTLERSVDGVNFELINTQKGSGTTSVQQSYGYLDREAPNGLSYYRLWQTDNDGKVNYVGVVSLRRGEASLGINSLLPIPVLEFLELTYTSIIESQIELQLYDALGKQLGSKTVGAAVGLNKETLDVSAYPPGIYFLTIIQGDVTITEKFIKE